MTTGWYVGPPGISTPRTTAARSLFLHRSENFLPQGRLIDGTKSRDPGNTPDVGVLRPGLLMGKITATGLYATSVIGVTTQAIAVGGTSITVSAAQAVEIVRRIGASGSAAMTIFGPPTANGIMGSELVTWSAVDQTTGIITCTALLNAYVAGSFLGGIDGSQFPSTLIPDWDYGVPVVDRFGVSVASVDYPHMPVSGMIHSVQILPAWPTDTTLQTWIKNHVGDVGHGVYIFDDSY